MWSGGRNVIELAGIEWKHESQSVEKNPTTLTRSRGECDVIHHHMIHLTSYCGTCHQQREKDRNHPILSLQYVYQSNH